MLISFRIDTLDFLRGMVMSIIALDKVRDYFILSPVQKIYAVQSCQQR